MYTLDDFLPVLQAFHFVECRDWNWNWCSDQYELYIFGYRLRKTGDVFFDIEDESGNDSHCLYTPDELYRALHNITRNNFPVCYKELKYEGY